MFSNGPTRCHRQQASLRDHLHEILSLHELDDERNIMLDNFDRKLFVSCSDFRTKVMVLRVVADIWEKHVCDFQAKSGSSGSCSLFRHFVGKIAVLKMFGKVSGSPRHPSSRHPRPSESCPLTHLIVSDISSTSDHSWQANGSREKWTRGGGLGGVTFLFRACLKGVNFRHCSTTIARLSPVSGLERGN